VSAHASFRNSWLAGAPSPHLPLKAPSQIERQLISPWEIAIFNPHWAQMECPYKPSFTIFSWLCPQQQPGEGMKHQMRGCNSGPTNNRAWLYRKTLILFPWLIFTFIPWRYTHIFQLPIMPLKYKNKIDNASWCLYNAH